MDKKAKLRQVYLKKLLEQSRKTGKYEDGGIPSDEDTKFEEAKELSFQDTEDDQSDDTSSLLKKYEEEKKRLADERKSANMLSALSYVTSLAGQPLGVNTQPLQFGSEVKSDAELAKEYEAKADMIKKLKDKKANNLYTVGGSLVQVDKDAEGKPVATPLYEPKPKQSQTKPQIVKTDEGIFEVTGEPGSTSLKTLKENKLPSKKSEGQKALDRIYAKDYQDWTSSGASQFEKNLSQLEQARNELTKMKGEVSPYSSPGRLQKVIPDIMQSGRLEALTSDVQETALAALRAALGAQFTEKEGEKIQNMSFNPNLSEEENLKKIDRTIEYLKQKADVANKKASHFEQNQGTLEGWKSDKPEVSPEKQPKPKSSRSWSAKGL